MVSLRKGPGGLCKHRGGDAGDLLGFNVSAGTYNLKSFDSGSMNIDGTIWGDAANDVIHGSFEDDASYAEYLRGEAGADTIHGNDGDDDIEGGDGDDTLNGGDGADDMDGGQGGDVMCGGDNSGDVLDDGDTDAEALPDKLWASHTAARDICGDTSTIWDGLANDGSTCGTNYLSSKPGACP